MPAAPWLAAIGLCLLAAVAFAADAPQHTVIADEAHIIAPAGPGRSVRTAASAPATVSLVDNGRARTVLVVPADADPLETKAATEIQTYVQKITGAKLDIIKPDVDRKAPSAIFIGRAGNDALDAKLAGLDPASFVLDAGPTNITIRGASPEATLFGAYEFLEQLGVRWFMPGEVGTVIPHAQTLALRQQHTVQSPSFGGRWFGGPPDWQKHMRMGGPYFPGSHGVDLGPDAEFAKHPEFYALIGGKRVGGQLCVSNPEVVRRAIAHVKAYFKQNPTAEWIGMGPNDGSGFCQCEKCRALDSGEWDPFAAEPAMTDRYVWFFNQILDGIKDEYPGKKICFYAYHTYMRPPVKIHANPLIVPALAPITLCRVHGPSNPLCPEKQYYAWLVTAWLKAVPEVYDRGYFFNLADPGFPFSMVHRVRDQIPLFKKLGIKGWRVETMNHWGSETPSLYIAGKLMWNANADVDALLQDFYDKFFGPASPEMRQYFTMMDAALRDGDYHTGCSFDLPHFYPATMRATARRLLTQADQAAGGGEGVYKQRVAMFRGTFDYLEAFIAMIEDRNRFDFAGAQKELDRLRVMQKQLAAHDPPLINGPPAKSYLDAFFAGCTEQGAKRLSGGNELVAPLEDEWEFQIDPSRIGTDLGWWKKENSGGNWQRLKTSSLSWSDQGLRYFKGEAWYRQSVKIPARYAGQRVFLWFGGVDEKAEVWVNGQLLGISHGNTFMPFEFDATPAVAAGQENVVVVRISNVVLDELGTGGIVSPVMFYAPAEGKDAKVENAAEMGTAFP